MTKADGWLVTCDVCGAQKFVKRRGRDADDASAWTAMTTFRLEDVCPDCRDKINQAVKKEIESIIDDTVPGNLYAFEGKTVPVVFEEGSE